MVLKNIVRSPAEEEKKADLSSAVELQCFILSTHLIKRELLKFSFWKF